VHIGDQSSAEQPARRSFDRGLLVLAGVVAVFAIHRYLVILSAGDFLYPLEPSEAKNTQIAWDLVSGRFGTGDFNFGTYLANSGSVHHASYSSGAFAYWFVSLFTGFTLLSVRLIPLLAWIGTLILWMVVLRKLLGTTAAALAGVGLFLVPTLFIAFQLTFLNCHPEAALPLSAVIAAWLWWLSRDGSGNKPTMLFGLCFGYAGIFSYLLWPFLALIVALTFVPPRPQFHAATRRFLALGVAVGLWPLWLILASDPAALFQYSITEREETTLFNMARGRGLDLDLYLQTVQENLPYAFHDFWLVQEEAGRLWGGASFESLSYKLLVVGSLVLLPWAITERDPLRRRLALLVSVGPPLVYLWLAFASPWKPNIPVRYLVPLGLLGFSAPGVGIGLAMVRIRSGSRSAWLLAALSAVYLLWLCPPRLHEARAAVQPERIEALRQHRYVSYYNLGIGTVWAEQVRDVNELIDVRTAQGSQEGFGGIQAGLWGSGDRLALGEGDWHPPRLTWSTAASPEPGETMATVSLFSGIQEWAERQSYLPRKDEVGGDLDDDPHRPVKDELSAAAQNIGWSVGIRAAWNSETVAAVVKDAQASGACPTQRTTHDAEPTSSGDDDSAAGDDDSAADSKDPATDGNSAANNDQSADMQKPCWPAYLDWQLVWEGYGFGLSRARPEISEHPDSLPSAIPETAREAVSRGIRAGRALGPVPKAPRKPLFKSVRGPAT